MSNTAISILLLVGHLHYIPCLYLCLSSVDVVHGFSFALHIPGASLVLTVMIYNSRIMRLSIMTQKTYQLWVQVITEICRIYLPDSCIMECSRRVLLTYCKAYLYTLL